MFNFREDKAGFFATLIVVPLLIGLAVVPLVLFLTGSALGQDLSLPIKIFFGVCWPLLVVTVLVRVWIFRVQMIAKKNNEQRKNQTQGENKP